MSTRRAIFIEAGEQPLRVNEVRRSRYKEAAETKRWRTAAYLTCIDHQEEPVARYPVAITITPFLSTRRAQDVGASFVAAKGAVDGLVDGGVLVDDDPKHVIQITHRAPILKAERPGLLIEISEPGTNRLPPNIDLDRLDEFYNTLLFDVIGRG